MPDRSRMSLVTPIVPVNNLARSRAFYVRLGFEVTFENEGYAILRRDEAAIHLSWSEGWPIEPRTNNTQFRVQITHVADYYAHCRQLGVVHPNGPLEAKPWGAREFAVLDPDHACITFYENDPPAE